MFGASCSAPTGADFRPGAKGGFGSLEMASYRGAVADLGTRTTDRLDSVLPRLETFHVIQNPRIRTIFGYLPALLVILIVVDWLIGTGNFSRDTFRMTAVLTVAIILAGIQVLFERFPKALESIWRRGAITSLSEHSDNNLFLAYIDQVEAALNAKYAWLVAFVC